MSEDTEKENIISLQGWREKREKREEEASIITAKEEEEDPIPAFDLGVRMAGNIFLAAAYAKGYSDGKIHKWMEIRWNVFILVLSNFISIAGIWWLLLK
jgi:hypothetical protein